MSAERDELARLVAKTHRALTPCEVTDAILTAGYRKPRAITTAEELDALPIGAMIMDQDPDVCRKREDGLWVSITDPEYAFGSRIMKDSLPATVLHEGATK